MIIKQHSLDEKEEDDNKERGEVAMLFRKVMGEVAYIKEGEIEQVELLGNFKAPRDAALGIDKGEKIYYADGDKTNRGFLSQREADEYIAGKNNRDKKKLISSGLGGKAKVFNNRTKKFEIWEK